MPFHKLKEDLIGYKKIKTGQYYAIEKRFIVTLLIPKGTMIFGDFYNKKDIYNNYYWGKLRAQKAVVLSIIELFEDCEQDINFKDEVDHVGWHNRTHAIKYKVGKIVKPHAFSKEYEECASGIHFFTEEAKALSYS